MWPTGRKFPKLRAGKVGAKFSRVQESAILKGRAQEKHGVGLHPFNLTCTSDEIN